MTKPNSPQRSHRLLGALAALALLGCASESLSQANDAIKQNPNAPKEPGAATLAPGAVATNMALMRLFNALSKETTGQSAIKGEQWTPSKSQGYRVVQGASLSTQYALDAKTGVGSLTGTENGKPVIDVTFRFSRTPATLAADQLGKVKTHYDLTDLKGTVSGFGIAWNGSFDYEPTSGAATAAGATIPADLRMQVKGNLKTATESLELLQLSLQTRTPTPSNVPQIGVVQLNRIGEGGSRVLMDGVIGIQDDQVTVNGTSSLLLAGQAPLVLQTFTLDRDGNLVIR